MNLILIRKVKVTPQSLVCCSKFFGTIAVLFLVFEKKIIRKKGHYSSVTAVQLLEPGLKHRILRKAWQLLKSRCTVLLDNNALTCLY